MLVLCRRANLGPEELTAEMLLTILWILESTSSQYRASLNFCLLTYLMLHPDWRAVARRLRHSMLDLQPQVCGWLAGACGCCHPLRQCCMWTRDAIVHPPVDC